MAEKNNYFYGIDGKKIFYRESLAKKAKNAIILVHGWSEHSGKYEEVIQFFVDNHYSVYAPDMRGHGLSEGERGYIQRWSQYLEDLQKLHEIISPDFPKPIIMGHSMGGLIAIRYAEGQAYNHSISALITSGAYLQLAFEVNSLKSMFATVMSNYFPKFSLKQELSASDFSSDPMLQNKHASDPLNHSTVNSRWFTEAKKAQKFAFDEADKLLVPCLIMHGSVDSIATVEGSQRLFREISTDQKELIIYDGMQHEILMELNRKQVFKDVAEWLKKYVE